MKIKKGDTVLIISGKDRGKRGTVEKTLPKVNKILVVGVNISKHHLKPSRKNPHGGIMDKLAPVDISNAMVVCPRCNQPSRLGFKLTESEKKKSARGGKIRICKKCKESID